MFKHPVIFFSPIKLLIFSPLGIISLNSTLFRLLLFNFNINAELFSVDELTLKFLIYCLDLTPKL